MMGRAKLSRARALKMQVAASPTRAPWLLVVMRLYQGAFGSEGGLEGEMDGVEATRYFADGANGGVEEDGVAWIDAEFVEVVREIVYGVHEETRWRRLEGKGIWGRRRG
jgi:hypothetical protein